MADMTTLDNCEDLSNATTRPVTEISRQGRVNHDDGPDRRGDAQELGGFSLRIAGQDRRRKFHPEARRVAAPPRNSRRV